MTSTSVIAVGLPNAGKSTFIAALGYVLQHKEIPTKLSLLKLSEDLSYINLLISDWLKCKPFERTKAGVKKVVFHLGSQSGPVRDLNFPDVSGETFEQHWELREWEPEFSQLVANASGILLFLHPKYLEKPFSVVDEARIAKAAGVENQEEGSDEQVTGASQEKPKEGKGVLWHPRRADSQAKLVDLLQMIARNTTSKFPLRLGIVISAWDVVDRKDPGARPLDWFQSSAPLLYQFVTMNPEQFQIKVFGVSAQGGDNEKDCKRLLEVEDPSNRVRISPPGDGEHDITGPLAWLLADNV